jgi:hypothetical protein
MSAMTVLCKLLPQDLMRVTGELSGQETGFQVFLLGALVEAAALMRFPQLPLLAVDPFASIAVVLFSPEYWAMFTVYSAHSKACVQKLHLHWNV